MENNNQTPVQNSQNQTSQVSGTVMDSQQISQNPSSPVEKSPRPNPIKVIQDKLHNLSPRNKTLVLVILILFAIIFILLLLTLIFGKKQTVVTVIPSPTPVSVSPTPSIILNASRYATDSGVLKLEENFNKIQGQLQGTDVRQSDLNLPDLDFNINFTN
jgi:hypothetical protein